MGQIHYGKNINQWPLEAGNLLFMMGYWCRWKLRYPCQQFFLRVCIQIGARWVREFLSVVVSQYHLILLRRPVPNKDICFYCAMDHMHWIRIPLKIASAGISAVWLTRETVRFGPFSTGIWALWRLLKCPISEMFWGWRWG